MHFDSINIQKVIDFFNEIKGMKVKDNDNTIYTIIDAKVFCGELYAIALQDSNGVVKYTTENVFNQMVTLPWYVSRSKS